MTRKPALVSPTRPADDRTIKPTDQRAKRGQAMRVDWASGIDGPGPAEGIADRVAAVELPGMEGWAFLVADGAGGSGDGQRAASTVAERFVDFVLGADRHGPPLDEVGTWVDFLDQLDRDLAQADPFGESTAVALVVTAERIVGASLGDSGAWLHRPESAEPWDVPTAGQRRKPLLGSGSAWPVGFDHEHRGGTLVLASDGLWNYAPPDPLQRLVEAGGPLDTLPAALIGLVRLRGGRLPDDVGVLVARIEFDPGDAR